MGVWLIEKIVKHRILGLDKRVCCANDGWTGLNNDVFAQRVVFWGHNDYTCITVFSGVNF